MQLHLKILKVEDFNLHLQFAQITCSLSKYYYVTVTQVHTDRLNTNKYAIETQEMYTPQISYNTPPKLMQVRQQDPV